MKKRINTYFKRQTNAAPLAVFRVFFGILMCISIIRFWSKGWINSLYIEPDFHFSYYGFEWVKPLGSYTYILFLICGISSLLVALGYKYRLAILVFFLSFTYIELMDKTTYLNHYYFVSVISFIMLFLPCNAQFSLDVVTKNKSYEKVPSWTIDSIKLMLGIVYFYAGLTKINSDWLCSAMPLKLWLKSKYDFNDNQIRKKTFSLAPFLSNKSSIQQGYLTSEPFLVEREAGFTPRVFLLADYGYPSYGAMVLASSNVLKNNPEIVKAFVDASIEGWRQYIYEDPSLGNELIMLENSEMKEDILLQAIKKIRNYELVSSENSKGRDIGSMTDTKWESFFKTMSSNGVYNESLSWRQAFTLDFINQEN